MLVNAGLFLLLALTWGSSFILMKRGLDAFDAVTLALLRISIATLFIMAIGFRRFVRLKSKDVRFILLVGFLGNGLPYLFFAIALAHIDSSIGGITNSLTPLFTLVVGAVMFRTPLRPLQIFGVILGLLGAVYLINPSGNAALDDNWPYALLTVLAAFLYAVSISTIKAKLQHLDSISITLFSISSVGIPAILALFLFTDFTQVLTTHELALPSLGYITILGIAGTGLAIILFNYLIKMASAMYAASITYFVPIVALGWGALDNEPITFNHLFGILAILGGIYLVNFAKIRATRRQPLN